MRSPRHDGKYDDRHLECQEALEDGFLDLVDAGEAAGWSRGEILAALTDLADNHVLAGIETDKTDKAIRDVMRKR